MSGEEASKSKEVLDAMSGVPLIVQYPSGKAYQFDPMIDSAISGCTHIQTGVIQIMPEEEASKSKNILDAMSGVPPLYQHPSGELY